MISPHIQTLEVYDVVDVLCFGFLCYSHFIEEFDLSILILYEVLESIYLVDSLVSEQY